MNEVLTRESVKELYNILQTQFGDKINDFSDDLVEDLGLTLINLIAIALKRKIKIEKHNNNTS